MLKKVIKYTDYNGNQRTETAYFNYNKLDILKLEAKLGDDVEAYSKKLAASKDVNKMINFIQDLVLGAYGQKSEDGRSFIKDPKKTEEFENSNAFADLFEELLTKDGYAQQFATGLVSGAKKQVAPVKGNH